MKKRAVVVVLIFFCTVFVSLFLNLGRFLDISQQPEKADAIVVLGGDWDGYRIKKALHLYQEGYARKIVLNASARIDLDVNGETFKTEAQFLHSTGIPKSDLLYIHNAGNTMYELRALKQLALKNSLKKLLLISAPPHLRRVQILASQAADFPQAGLSIVLIGSDPSWWHKKEWYRNKTARNFVLAEMIKIVSNYTAYVILQKHGLLEPIRTHFGPLIDRIKNFFQAQLRRLGNG